MPVPVHKKIALTSQNILKVALIASWGSRVWVRRVEDADGDVFYIVKRTMTTGGIMAEQVYGTPGDALAGMKRRLNGAKYEVVLQHE